MKEWIAELLSKVDIVSLISRYVRLTRRGNDYWACCPFHSEKTPSFKIYEHTNSFHCFGCKAGGDAISFLAKIESIERIDAIKLLAEEVGMQLPKLEGRKSLLSSEEIVKKKDRLYGLLASTARFYYDNLQSKGGEQYREYLYKRKIGDDLIKKFGIGASLDWRSLIDHLSGKGYTSEEMKEAGVAAEGKEGLYDVYKGRVMFPIISIFDKVVSFSGRIIDSEEYAKYKNGIQTIVFEKSKTLFAANLLKVKKKKESIGKFEHVILVEGHLDAVMMHGAGFDTTVASMGTALTSYHAKQIKNFTDKVYISYDGDAAGDKATLRGLDILAETGINVKVVKLPDKMDPDDIIKMQGREAYVELLKNADSLTAYKINSLKSKYDLGDVDDKSKFAVSAVRIIKRLDSPVQREEYLTLISNITGYTMNALRRQADSTEEEQIVPTIKQNKMGEKIFNDLAVQMLNYVVDGNTIPSGIELGEGLDGIYLEIYNHIVEKGVGVLYASFDEEQHPLIGEIINYEGRKLDSNEDFVKTFKTLQIQKLEKQKEKLNEESKKLSFSNEKERVRIFEILEQIKEIDFRIKSIGGR